MVANLTDRAMLVRLSISQWEGRKRDKSITKEVASAKHAEADAGAWWTHLVSRLTLRAIHLAEDAAREWHNKQTLPWTDAGLRILPATNFLAYTTEMRKLQAAYMETVEAFVAEYPALMAGARRRLGSLFIASNFPTPACLRGKFRFAVDILPLPAAEDFRVDLGTEVTQQVKAEMQGRLDVAFQDATRDLWERMHTAISRVVDRLSDPEKIFRDSLIGNLNELCELLPKLNVTNDTKLAAMTKAVRERLGKCKPAELRDDPKERAKAAAAAKDILAKMAGYVGKAGEVK